MSAEATAQDDSELFKENEGPFFYAELDPSIAIEPLSGFGGGECCLYSGIFPSTKGPAGTDTVRIISEHPIDC